MALSKLVCPECDKVLRPTNPVAPGKKVRCPKCETVFVARAEEEDEDEEDDRPARKPAKKAKPAPAKKAEKKPAASEDDGAYGVIRESEEEEENRPKIKYAPDDSIKDLRGPAIAKLTPPASKLTMSGFIGVAGAVILILLLMIPAFLPIQEEPPKEGFRGQEQKPKKVDAVRYKAWFVPFKEMTEARWYIFLLCLIPFVLMGLYSALVTHGSIKANNLESRGWGIAASIMAMLPLNTFCAMCALSIFIRSMILFVLDDEDWIDYVGMGLGSLFYLLSLASGIWTLLTLNDEDVKAGFEYHGE